MVKASIEHKSVCVCVCEAFIHGVDVEEKDSFKP